MKVAILLFVSVAILLIGYLTAISSRDLVRLLVSLELMFGSVFLALLPLFSIDATVAFGIAVITIFTSSSELMILIASIIMLDRKTRDITVDSVTAGGDTA